MHVAPRRVSFAEACAGVSRPVVGDRRGRLVRRLRLRPAAGFKVPERGAAQNLAIQQANTGASLEEKHAWSASSALADML